MLVAAAVVFAVSVVVPAELAWTVVTIQPAVHLYLRRLNLVGLARPSHCAEVARRVEDGILASVAEGALD